VDVQLEKPSCHRPIDLPGCYSGPLSRTLSTNILATALPPDPCPRSTYPCRDTPGWSRSTSAAHRLGAGLGRLTDSSTRNAYWKRHSASTWRDRSWPVARRLVGCSSPAEECRASARATGGDQPDRARRDPAASPARPLQRVLRAMFAIGRCRDRWWVAPWPAHPSSAGGPASSPSAVRAARPVHDPSKSEGAARRDDRPTAHRLKG